MRNCISVDNRHKSVLSPMSHSDRYVHKRRVIIISFSFSLNTFTSSELFCPITLVKTRFLKTFKMSSTSKKILKNKSLYSYSRCRPIAANMNGYSCLCFTMKKRLKRKDLLIIPKRESTRGSQPANLNDAKS